jgi:hypothetical protein
VILSDEIVFATPCVTVGQFQCSADHPDFRDTGPIERDLVVFPRVPVWIRHHGGAPFVADPNVATMYNRGQEYTRAPLDGAGDRSDWFAVSRATALALASAADPGHDPDREPPFRRQFAPTAPRLYARQRMVLHRLKSAEGEPLAKEEAVL